MSALRVFVSDWQYECCGDPFAVGDEVTWTVEPTPPGDETLRAAGVEAYEDHHEMAESPTREVSGTVRGIAILARQFREDAEGVWRPVKGRFRLHEIDRSPRAGFVYELTDSERWKQTGMVVDLDLAPG